MAMTNPFLEHPCQQLLDAFFTKFPNERLRHEAGGALVHLLLRNTPMPGKPGGWAGGIVYAVGASRYGIPGILNRELEEAFGTTMGTIRKRAARIRDVLDL